MSTTLRYAVILLVVSFLIPVAIIDARTPMNNAEKMDEPLHFRKYVDVERPSIKIPTVFEIDVTGLANTESTLGAYNATDGTFEWTKIHQNKYTPTQKMTMLSSTAEGPTFYMSDGNMSTYTDFFFPDNGPAETRIDVEFEKSVSSDTLKLTLGANVALPTTIAIYAKRTRSDEERRTALAPTSMGGETVRFPMNNGKYWTIVLTHTQPLRIVELSFSDVNAKTEGRPTVRFLAQPEKEYRIYYSPEGNRTVDYKGADMPNLNRNDGVITVGHGESKENPLFREADSDGDGVVDAKDNCRLSNPLQTDVDQNGEGDECDDFDRDGASNSMDNCVSEPNRDQKDTDQDGVGDACDAEENRFTERHAWVPWAGIGFAGFVILTLFGLMLRMKPEKE